MRDEVCLSVLGEVAFAIGLPDVDTVLASCARAPLAAPKSIIGAKTLLLKVLLLGICFWRKGREERNCAGFIGEKGGCGGKRGRRRRFGVAAGGVLEKNPAIRTMFDRSREPLARVSSLDERSFPVRLAKVFLAAVFSLIAAARNLLLAERP